MSRTLSLLFTLVLAAGACTGKPADLLLINGAVYTVVPRGTWAEAIAVKNGRIVYAGTSEGAARYRVPGVRVVDLDGKMVLPGFHDSHAHALQGGVTLGMCRLGFLKTPEEYLDAIRKYAEDNPKKEWIAGMGWQLDAFADGNPGRELLDTVTGKRPAAFVCSDGHSLWANSAALAKAGITKRTRDPAGGRIERDTYGDPSGTLRESAMDAVIDLAFDPNPYEAVMALRRGIAEANKNGITSFIDATVDTEALYHWVYRILYYTGGLNARVTMALLLDPKRVDTQADELIGIFSNDQSRSLKADHVKIFIDGVTETRTAAVFEPYRDRERSTGTLMFDSERLRRAAVKLDRAGFQLHMHTVGDRAVHEALDIIETIYRENGPHDARPTLVHLYLVRPDDVKRLGKLGVYANMQPYWACPAFFNDVNLKLLGPCRYNALMPLRTLRDAGVIIAGGTDWPVDVFSPLEEITVALTRQVPGTPGNAPTLNASERVDLATMIEAYTICGARLQRRENLTGSIEKGKYADLVILERNIFMVPPREIRETRVVATLLEGKIVYPDDMADGLAAQ